jgi:hypothetical protein
MSGIPLAITFGSKGDYKLWVGEGWHGDSNDPTHTWSGNLSTLRLLLDDVRRDARLSVSLMPPGVDQDVFVYLNGRFVAFWQVSQGVEMSAMIQARFFERGENILTFVLPKAICPKVRGVSNDQRVLGAAFSKLSLTY